MVINCIIDYSFLDHLQIDCRSEYDRNRQKKRCFQTNFQKRNYKKIGKSVKYRYDQKVHLFTKRVVTCI